MTLEETLIWLVSGGGAASIASWILERIPWYQQQSSETRRWIFVIVSLVLAVGAYAVIQFVPQETIDIIAPWFAVIAGVAVPILAGQAAHYLDPARKRN